jgi:hypothetical protein
MLGGYLYSRLYFSSRSQRNNFDFSQPFFDPPIVYLLSAGLIYAALVWPYIRARAFVKTVQGTAGNSVVYLIEPQIVVERRKSAQMQFDWNAIVKAKQTSNLILLYFGGHPPMVIPKRCFKSAQDLNTVRSIIASKTILKGKRLASNT